MALSQVETVRVFKVGQLTLNDPMPNAPLSESVRVLSRTYPQFRQSKLYEEDGVPTPNSNEIVYELQLPPPKKNG